MKRTKPLKRSGFKVKAAKVKAKPQAAKCNYVRDLRLRDMCRAMACQHCGARGGAAGVTWAHSNLSIHGKGWSIKASDVYVAALCATCHRELDQGKTWTRDERVQVWTDAHRRTIATARLDGTWPVDIALPAGADFGRPLRKRQARDSDYYALLKGDGGWMSARAVAATAGASWYVVAFALRRLCERGLTEEDVVDVVGAARTVEHSRVYRARPQPGEVKEIKTNLPAWLCPQAVVAAGEPRLVRGSASMRRWDATGATWGDDDDELVASRVES